MGPTSEQELKQLLQEGRITEDEYKELLEVIRQKEATRKPVEKSNKSKPRTGFGKAALILMIVGLLTSAMPFVLASVLGGTTNIFGGIGWLALFGLPCFLLAFIFGIIGFKSPGGKIAAFGVPCLGLFLALGVLLIVPLWYLRLAELGPGVEIRSFVSHKAYPLDSLEGVLTRNNVEMDSTISFDGNGSLKVQSDTLQKTIIRLFETGPMNIENRMLIYQAKIKSNLTVGKAYLEMWCDFPGKGEFFSRSPDQPITGTTEWTAAQTPFRLEAGQIPSNVKLNLVIEGTGTVWIDDIKVLSSTLN